MNCPEDEQLVALVEGGLDADSREPVAAHLEACAECLEVVTTLLRAQGKTRSTPLPSGAEWAGRYRVGRILGRGAMGDVYGARDGKLDRDVALKILADAGELMSPSARERFERESKTMARLDHPHLITVFDADVWNGRPYVAMQLISGSTMRTWAPEQPWRRIVDAYVKVAAGLATAHASGVLHRDIKPDNVLVDDGGSPVLTDFGLATTDSRSLSDDLDPDDRLTRPGAAIGTPAYMAPQRLVGGHASVGSDVYEFAASLYESLYGQPPARPARVGVMARGQRLPLGLRRALARALDPDATRRYASMTAVRRALLAPERWRRWLMATAGVAMIALLGGFIGTGLATAGPKSPCDTKPGSQWWQSRGQPQLAAHPHGSDLSPRVADHIAQWEATRQTVCVASEGGVSATSTERQLACLDTNLQHAIGVVEAVDDSTDWDAAMLAIDQLRSPERCLAVDRVIAEAPLPEEKGDRARARALRDRLARVEGQLAAGAVDVGADLAAIRSDVDAFGYAPLHAETLLLEAESEVLQGRPQEAQRLTLEAMHQAEAASHDVLVARAATALTPRTAFLGEHERAAEYAKRAEASLVRLQGMFPELEASAANNQGIAAHRAGDFDKAGTLFSRAVELHGPGTVKAAESKIGVAGALFQSGRTDEALALRLEALQELLEQRGERHPQVLRSFADLAGLHMSLGHYDEATPMVTRAMDLTRQVLGDQHPDYAKVLTMRGGIRTAQGDHAGALHDFDLLHVVYVEARWINAPADAARGSLSVDQNQCVLGVESEHSNARSARAALQLDTGVLLQKLPQILGARLPQLFARHQFRRHRRVAQLLFGTGAGDDNLAFTAWRRCGSSQLV